MFFFSSRRRHTRCLSDWSSDVCSSDLLRLTQVLVRLLQSGVEPHLTRGERQVLAQLTEKLAVGARKACRLAPGCDHDAKDLVLDAQGGDHQGTQAPTRETDRKSVV